MSNSAHGVPGAVEPVANVEALRAEIARLQTEVARLRAMLPDAPGQLEQAADDPKPTYADLVARVAHERQQFLEREWLLAVINSLPDDVFFVNAEGRLVFANDIVRESLGLSSKEDVLGILNGIEERFEVLKPDGTPRKPEESPFLPAFRGKTVHGEEMVRHRRTGELRQRSYHVVPVRLGDKVVGAVSLVRDITESKRAEQERESLLAELRAIVSSMPDGLITYKKNSAGAVVNHAALQILGVSPEDWPSTVAERARLLQVQNEAGLPVDPDVSPAGRASRGETVSSEIRRIQRLDGEERWVSVGAAPIKAATGEQIGALTVFTDITERKRADEALQESEHRYRSLFENSLDAIFLSIPNQRIVAANPAACAIFGMTEEELCRVGRQGIEDPTDPRHALAVEERSRTGRVKYEATHVRKDGTKFPSEVTSVVLEGGSRAFVTLRDVSERKRAEAALRDSEKRASTQTAELQAIFDAAPIAVFVTHDRDAKSMTGNRAAHELLRVPTAANLSKSAPEPERPSSFRAIRDGREIPSEDLPAQVSARRGVEVRGYEFDVVFDDGETRHLLCNATPVKDEHGNPAGSVAALIDVTQVKQADEALRASEERLRLALSAGSMATWDWRVPSGEVIWNDEHFRMLGYEPGTIPPSYQAWAERIHPEDRAATEKLVSASVERGGEYSSVFRSLRPDGTVRWIEARGRMEHDAAGKPLRQYGVMLDITERKRAETALQTTLDRFYSVLSSMYSAVLLVTDEGRVEFANPAFRKRFGLEDAPAGLVGLSSGDMIEKIKNAYLRPEEAVARIRDILDRGEAVKGEELTMGDGGTCLRDFVPLSFHGQSCGRLWIHLDITERKRAEEVLAAAHRQIQSVIDNTPAIVYAFDLEERFIMANATVAELLNSTPEQMIGRRRHEFMPKEDADWHEANDRQAIETGKALEFEECSQLKGHSITWLTTKFPLRDAQGRIYAVAGISSDITERKQSEEALQGANLQLAEADRQKNRFLAVLSHELRNPLTPITNSLLILNRAAAGGEQASRAKAVIERQVAHLTRLVDDLLDVSRIISGKLRLQRARFDLAQVLRRTAEDHHTVLADGGIRLDVHVSRDPCWMDGDETRMAQAVGNLLGNSAKFTQQGGAVVLELEAAAATGTAFIRVRDTGVGVHPDLLDRLFEPFVQADSTLDRSKSGLGLGLALVKSVIGLHGGTVEVHSDGPGKGTEFVLRVPIDAQAVGAAGAERHPSDRAPPRRVLIIEDNVDAADSLKEAVELGAHQVEVAHDGPQGIKKAREFSPDVVLCDIGLPGMSGYDVAKAFRADEKVRSTHLVALTGYALPEDLQRATDAGFDAHIAKPPSLEKIEEMLRALPVRVLTLHLPKSPELQPKRIEVKVGDKAKS